jgi:hypothetical protein
LHDPLALGNREREILRLLTADEQPAELELAYPVRQVRLVGRLVQAQRLVERREVGRPDAHEMLARVGLGVDLLVIHCNPLW